MMEAEEASEVQFAYIRNYKDGLVPINDFGSDEDSDEDDEKEDSSSSDEEDDVVEDDNDNVDVDDYKDNDELDFLMENDNIYEYSNISSSSSSMDDDDDDDDDDSDYSGIFIGSGRSKKKYHDKDKYNENQEYGEFSLLDNDDGILLSGPGAAETMISELWWMKEDKEKGDDDDDDDEDEYDDVDESSDRKKMDKEENESILLASKDKQDYRKKKEDKTTILEKEKKRFKEAICHRTKVEFLKKLTFISQKCYFLQNRKDLLVHSSSSNETRFDYSTLLQNDLEEDIYQGIWSTNDSINASALSKNNSLLFQLREQEKQRQQDNTTFTELSIDTLEGLKESQHYRNVIELCLQAFWVVFYSKVIPDGDECYMINNTDAITQLRDDIDDENDKEEDEEEDHAFIIDGIDDLISNNYTAEKKEDNNLIEEEEDNNNKVKENKTTTLKSRMNIQRQLEDDESIQSEHGNKYPYAPLGIVRDLWRQVLLQYFTLQQQQKNDNNDSEEKVQLKKQEQEQQSNPQDLPTTKTEVIDNKNGEQEEKEIIKEKVEKMLQEIELAFLSQTTNFFKVVEIQDLLESSFVAANNSTGNNTTSNISEDIMDVQSLYENLYSTLPTTKTIQEITTTKKKQYKSRKNYKKNYEIRFRGSFLKRYAWLFLDSYKNIQPIITVFEDDDTVPLSKKQYKAEQQQQQDDDDDTKKEEWNFANIFYCKVLQTIFQKNILKKEEQVEEEEEENVEQALSCIYTLRYLSSFLLHNYDSITSLLEGQDSYLDVLLNPSYILERFHTFGILEGSMIHLDDAQDYLSLTTLTVTNNKRSKSSFYIEICQSIQTCIETILSTVQSVHKSKLQSWHKRIQQHQQYNKYIDSSILSQSNDSNDAFLRCILNYESGKVMYMLGITIAKKSFRVCTKEKIQFLEFGFEKFRLSLQFLSTASSNNNNSSSSTNSSSISKILQSKQQIPTIEREINLSIADTLSCLAYIYDVEQKDYTKSSDYYNQSLSLYSDIHGKYHMTCSQTLHNLGTLYVLMEDYEEGLKYYTQCLNIRKRIHKEQEEVEDDDDDSIIESNQQLQQNSNKKKKKNIMEEEEVAYTYRCMAETCRNIGSLSLAKQYNQVALKIFVQVCGKNQLIVALILSSIASLYLDSCTSTKSKSDNENLGEVTTTTINQAQQQRKFTFSENYQQVLECLNESIRIRKLHYNNNNNNNDSKHKTWKNVGYDLAHNLHSKGKLLLWNGGYRKESLSVLKEELKLREELLEKLLLVNENRNKDDSIVANIEVENDDDGESNNDHHERKANATNQRNKGDDGDVITNEVIQRRRQDHYGHILSTLLLIIQIHGQSNEYDEILSCCNDILKRIDMFHATTMDNDVNANSKKKLLLDRNHADVLFLIGRILLKKDDYMQAYSKFEMALQLYRNQLQLHSISFLEEEKINETKQQQALPSSSSSNAITILRSKIASTLYFIGSIHHDVDVDWIENNLNTNDSSSDTTTANAAMNYFRESIELRMITLQHNKQQNNINTLLLPKSIITLAQLQMSDMLHRSVQLSLQQQQDNNNSSAFLSYVIKSIQMKEHFFLPFLSEIASSSDNIILASSTIQSNWYDDIGEGSSSSSSTNSREHPLLIEDLDCFHLYLESDDKEQLDGLFGCYRLYIDMVSSSSKQLLQQSNTATSNSGSNMKASSSWFDFTKEITTEAVQYFTNPTVTIAPTANETDATNTNTAAAATTTTSSSTFPSLLQVSSVTIDSKDIITSIFTKEKILWKMAMIFIYKHLHHSTNNNDSTHLEKAFQLLTNVLDLLSAQRLHEQNDDVMRKNERNSFLGHYVYPSLGYIHSLNKQYGAAKEQYINALQILQKDNTSDNEEDEITTTAMNTIPTIHIQVLVSLGKIEIETEEYKNAIMYLEEGLAAQQRYFTRKELQQVPLSESDRTQQAQHQNMSSSLDDLSSTHLSIATTLYYLAVAYEHFSITDHGRTSLSLFTKALKIRTYKLGKRHVQVSDILLHIGHVHRKTVLHSTTEYMKKESKEEYLKEAKKFYEEALNVKKEAYEYQTSKGELTVLHKNKVVQLVDMASLIFNISEVYGMQKEYEKAVNHYSQALTMYQNQQQDNKSHPSSNSSSKSIADIYDALGRMYYGTNFNEESLKCFQESLNIRSEFISSDKSGATTSDFLKIASTYYKIGFVHQSMLSLDEALDSFTESLRLHRQFLTSKNLLDLSTAYLLDSMSEIYFTHKQDYNLALKACRQALKIYRSQCGDDNVQVGKMHFRIGLLIEELNMEISDALDHFQDAARILEVYLENDTPSSINTQEDDLFRKNDKNDESSICAILQECFEKYLILTKQMLVEEDDDEDETYDEYDNDEISDVFTRLANVHVLKHNYKDALTCFGEAKRINVKNFGSNHLSVANSLHNIAMIHYEKGEYKVAIEEFMESLTITKSIAGNGTEEESESLLCLGNCYQKLENYSKSLMLLQGSYAIKRARVAAAAVKDGSNVAPGADDDVSIAKILVYIGDTYESLNEFDSALNVYNEARQLCAQLSEYHMDKGKIIQRVGSVYQHIGDYRNAIACYMESLKIQRYNLGQITDGGQNNDNLSISNLLISIGSVHELMQEYDNALHCYNQGLQTITKMHGPDSCETAKALRNVGGIHDEKGNLDLALNYFRESLRIFHLRIGDEDVDVADCLHNQAIVYGKKNEWKKSIKSYFEAARIYRLKLKDQDSNDTMKLSQTLLNLGIVLSQKRNYRQSIKHLLEALTLKQETFGLDHLGVAEALHHLGHAYYLTQNNDAALAYFKECLQIRVKNLGKNDLDIAITLFSLGLCFNQQGEFKSSKRCFSDCLSVRTKLGDTTSNELADLYFRMGKVERELGNLEEAILYLQKSLQLKIKIYGKDSLPIQEIIFILGILLCEYGNYTKAIDLFKDSYRISKLHMSNNKGIDKNEQIGTIMENIGISYYQLGKFEEATKCYEKSLTLKKNSKSKKLPHQVENTGDIAICMHMLGNCYHRQQNHHKALSYMKEGLRIKIFTLGKDDPEVAISFHDLGLLYFDIGDDYNALTSFEESLRLRRLEFSEDFSRSTWEIGETLFSMAKIYAQRQDTEITFRLLDEAMKIMERELGIDENSESSFPNNFQQQQSLANPNINKIRENKFSECLSCNLRCIKEERGNEHPQTAVILIKLANLSARQGLNNNAVEYYTESIQIQKKVVGEDHLQVGDTIFNLANVLSSKGDYIKSAEYYETTMTLTKSFLGKDHEHVAETSTMMANAYYNLSDFQKSIDGYMEAYRIRVLVHGEDSTSVTDIMYSMSIVYNRIGKYDKALDLASNVLKLTEAKLGKRHPSLAKILATIGTIRKNKGDLSDAYQLLLDALKLAKLDQNYMLIATTLQDIASIYEKSAVFDKSSKYYNQALQIYEMLLLDDSFFGSNSVESSLTNKIEMFLTTHREKNGVEQAQLLVRMGQVYARLNQLENSTIAVENALKLYEFRLNEDNLNKADALAVLGNIYVRRCNFRKAMDCLQQSLRIKKLKLPDNHLEVEEILIEIGNLCIDMDDNHLALSFLSEATKLKKSRMTSDNIDTNSTQVNDADTLFQLGILHQEHHDYGKAMRCFEEVLSIRKMIFGNDSLETAEAFHHIGSLFRATNDMDRAILRFNDALKIKVKMFGSRNLDVAKTLFHLGIAQCEKGEFDDAMVSYEESYRIRKELLGDDHEEIAHIFSNMGIIFYEQRSNEKSVAYLEKALKIFKNKLGEDSEEAAYTFHLIGNVHREMGDLENAMKYFIEAIMIEKKRLGRNHLDVANTLEESLRIRIVNQGEEDESVGDTYFNLAYTQLKEGDKSSSIKNFEVAIRIKEKLYDFKTTTDEKDEDYQTLQTCYRYQLLLVKKKYGADHIKCGDLCEGRGNLYTSKQNYEKALQFYAEAVRIYKIHYGVNHLSIGNILHNMANTLFENNEKAKALKCYEKSLQITKPILGNDHENIAETVQCIARLHQSTGDFVKAEESYGEALLMRKQLYGDNHLAVASCLHNLGVLYSLLENYDKAWRCFQESLRIRKLNLENTDIEVSNSLFFLGTTYKNMSKNTNAVTCYEESLKIRIKVEDIRTGDLLLSLGTVHENLDNIEQALLCYSNALRVYTLNLGEDDLVIATTLIGIGNTHDHLEEYEKAIECFKKALQIKTYNLGEDHEEVADVLVALANAYEKTQNNPEALDYYAKSVLIYRKIDREHLSTARSLHLMANVHLRTQNHIEAMHFLTECLRIRLLTLSENHEDVGDTYYLIGMVKLALKKDDVAFENFEKSHVILEGKRGIDHLSTSNSIWYMGTIYERRGDHEKALRCYETCILGRLNCLGESHLDVAECLYRMGNMHFNLSEKEKSLACQEQSLKIRRLNYDTDHICVAQCLFSLGDIHLHGNELDTSLDCFSESKDILNTLFHDDHLLIAKVLGRIANVHSYLYNDSEAVSYYQESLTMYKKCLDLNEYVITKISIDSDSKDDYMDYAESSLNLGIVFEAMEKYGNAKESLTESLRIFKSIFGKEDLNVAKAILGIGLLHAKKNKFDKAATLLREALRVRKLKLGDNDDLVATTYVSLGVVYEKARRYQEALKSFEDALQIRIQTQGRISLEVAQTLNNIAICLGNMKKFREAVVMWEKALEILIELDVSEDEDIAQTISNYISVASSQYV